MSLHPQHPLRDLRSLHCCHNFLCLPPLPSFYFFPLIPLFLPCPYTVCTGLTRPDTTPHHTTDATFTVVWREGGIVNVCVDERERERLMGKCVRKLYSYLWINLTGNGNHLAQVGFILDPTTGTGTGWSVIWLVYPSPSTSLSNTLAFGIKSLLNQS